MARIQKFYTKEREHNPNCVEAGKLRAEKQRANGRWESDMTRVVRTSHLGYDCYATGKITGEAGKIRCLLKSTRLPSHISHDIMAILPVEMWWPERDHRAAHALIDAVITFDLNSLASWKSLWPQHEFGYEQFMALAERHLTHLNAKTLDSVKESNKLLMAEKRADPKIEAVLPKPSLFPCEMVRCEPCGDVQADLYRVSLAIAWFADGSAALRVSLHSQPMEGEHRVLLSRAYVDLVDGTYEVIENYPGRYRALGLPTRMFYEVLGVRSRRKALARRTGPAKPQSPREPILERSGRILNAITSGDPYAPAPERVAVEETPPDVDLTVFPPAPGQLAL